MLDQRGKWKISKRVAFGDREVEDPKRFVLSRLKTQDSRAVVAGALILIREFSVFDLIRKLSPSSKLHGKLLCQY